VLQQVLQQLRVLCDMSQEQWYVGKLAGNSHLRYCSMNIKQWKNVLFTGAIAPAVNKHMI
jgi:hypothetical protein